MWYLEHGYTNTLLVQCYSIAETQWQTVSNIADDYLFNKEIVKSGLKRKREPENIVGTKKSKKKSKLRRL